MANDFMFVVISHWLDGTTSHSEALSWRKAGYLAYRMRNVALVSRVEIVTVAEAAGIQMVMDYVSEGLGE